MRRDATSALVTGARVGPVTQIKEVRHLDTVRPDYVEQNKAAWERWAPRYAAAGREAWRDQLRWGAWGVPESEAGLLEGIEPQTDVLELGCGTAAISSWLLRLGLRPIGVDISRPQLERAAELQREFGISFGLLCANAEQLHFEDSSFGMAVSEYGASLWCDPRRWLPEAHRVLRPGGRLVFITTGALLMACTPEDGSPPGERLVRDYVSEYAVFPGDDGAVEFHLTHGDWIRLLRDCGFTVENLLEVRPPPHATPRFNFVSAEWGRRWPSEEIWIASKSDRR
jgi:SAM-dependent methyltransferase